MERSDHWKSGTLSPASLRLRNRDEELSRVLCRYGEKRPWKACRYKSDREWIQLHRLPFRNLRDETRNLCRGNGQSMPNPEIIGTNFRSRERIGPARTPKPVAAETANFIHRNVQLLSATTSNFQTINIRNNSWIISLRNHVLRFTFTSNTGSDRA